MANPQSRAPGQVHSQVPLNGPPHSIRRDGPVPPVVRPPVVYVPYCWALRLAATGPPKFCYRGLFGPYDALSILPTHAAPPGTVPRRRHNTHGSPAPSLGRPYTTGDRQFARTRARPMPSDDSNSHSPARTGASHGVRPIASATETHPAGIHTHLFTEPPCAAFSKSPAASIPQKIALGEKRKLSNARGTICQAFLRLAEISISRNLPIVAARRGRTSA